MLHTFADWGLAICGLVLLSSLFLAAVKMTTRFPRTPAIVTSTTLAVMGLLQLLIDLPRAACLNLLTAAGWAVIARWRSNR